MTLRSLRVLFALLAGTAWAAAFVMGMFTQDYVLLGISTPLVMVAAGAVFAAKNGNGNGGKS